MSNEQTANEHYTKAKSRLHNGTTNEVARAGVEATLALAYEQRTANLIAAMQPVILPDGESLGLSVQKCAQIQQRIIERLGLA